MGIFRCLHVTQVATRSSGDAPTAIPATAVRFYTLPQALDVHASRHFNALRVHPAVIR